MLDENLIDRLQIIFRRQVHDGQVLVVKHLVFIGRVAIAPDEVDEQILVRVHMPVEVHDHEPGKLEEARIHQPPVPRIRPGNRGDYRAPEPVGALFLGEPVHRRLADAGIDWPALHDKAARNGRAFASLHQRNRGEDRDRGLADGHHMHIAIE